MEGASEPPSPLPLRLTHHPSPFPTPMLPSPSPAPIESLPVEIVRQILDGLSLSELARLSIGSKLLRRRLEPILFESETARNRAMKWACEQGVTSVIDRSISYGSPVSVVPFLPNPRREEPSPEQVSAHDGGPTGTLTLYLAAKHGRKHAFQHLLDLGAQIGDPSVDPHTVEALLKRICSPADTNLLASLLKAGLASQLTQEMLDDGLLSVLRSAKDTVQDPDLIRTLLNSGANPNCVHSSAYRQESISPLSLTLIYDHPELFDLLLKQGANIDSLPILRPVPAIPCHVPICAAAYAMPQRGEVFVERCLDHGAQLNIQTLVLRNKRHRELSFTSPFLIYLGRISSWEGADGSTALLNIEYLLGKGAALEMDGIARPDDPALFSGRYRFQPPPTAIELLLDKWSVLQLSQPLFLSALKLLVKHGALQRHSGIFLARYDYDPAGDSLNPAVLSAWEELLDAILADPSRHEDIHMLLCTYITAKGISPKLDVYSSAKPTITDLTRATITRLLRAGADVNTRQAPGDPTALHELCWRYSKAEYLHDSGAEPSNLNYTERLNPNRAGFLRFLVEECGADPRAEWQGRTPAETLRLGRVKLGDTEKKRVDELIGFLEDKRARTMV